MTRGCSVDTQSKGMTIMIQKQSISFGWFCGKMPYHSSVMWTEETVYKQSGVINQREVQFTDQDVQSLRKLEITRKRWYLHLLIGE